MSYILDALKKSEEQRNNGKVVAPSFHTQPRPYKKTTYYFFPITIALMLVFVLIASIYFFGNKNKIKLPGAFTETTIAQDLAADTPGNIDTAKKTLQPGLINSDIQTVLNPALKQLEKKQINDDPFNDKFTSFNKQGVDQSSIRLKSSPVQNIRMETEKSKTKLSKNITNLYESPSHLKNQIPKLDYSSHWHDPISKNSVIIINNISYKEGSWINKKIKIEKILQDETIFIIGRDKFKLNSLQNWGN